MFGLSVKKTLARCVANACQNNRNVYKQAIVKNLDAIVQAENDEEKQKKIFTEVRNEYLTKVFDDVVKAMSISSPTIETRVRLAIMSPGLCGIPDRDIDDGVMAGTVYAICYWAMKNKVAPSGDCIALNHYQNDIMNEVLHEVDRENP